MKTFLLIAMIVSLSMCYSYVWHSALDTEASIDDAAFYMAQDFYYAVYYGGSTIYVDDNGTPETFTVYLPVKGVVPVGDTEFLFAMGDGSDSDGIYLMDFDTGDFEVIFYTYKPTFIKYCEASCMYYSGDETGMWSSSDGLNWTFVESFGNITCEAMTWCDGHYIAASPDAVYTSDDAGTIWVESEFAPWVNDFAWSHDGATVFGIFPGTSYSSGLWRSTDYGVNWEVVMYEVMLSNVNVDLTGEVFIGYEEDGGVGIMDIDNGTVSTINDGLPNLNINNIRPFPLVDCAAELACTDQGAYFVTDYSMGSTDEDVPQSDMIANVYPNPFNPETTIELDLPKPQTAVVHIYNTLGQEVRTLTIPEAESKTVWNGTDRAGHPVASGVYLVRIETGGQSITRKALLMK